MEAVALTLFRRWAGCARVSAEKAAWQVWACFSERRVSFILLHSASCAAASASPGSRGKVLWLSCLLRGGNVEGAPSGRGLVEVVLDTDVLFDMFAELRAAGCLVEVPADVLAERVAARGAAGRGTRPVS